MAVGDGRVLPSLLTSGLEHPKPPGLDLSPKPPGLDLSPMYVKIESARMDRFFAPLDQSGPPKKANSWSEAEQAELQQVRVCRERRQYTWPLDRLEQQIVPGKYTAGASQSAAGVNVSTCAKTLRDAQPITSLACAPSTNSADTPQTTGVNRSALLSKVYTHGVGCSEVSLQAALRHLTEFAHDRLGYLHLIAKLDAASESSDADRRLLVDAVVTASLKLAWHRNGCEVVRRSLDFATQQQLRALMQQMRPRLQSLALDKYGCWVVQSLIELGPSDVQIEVVKELEGHVNACVMSMHGNHVMQKCIEHLRPSSLKFIIDEITTKTQDLATHKFGCRVIQRLLEFCSPTMLEDMLELILARVSELGRDAYGNYVLKHVLQFGRLQDKQRILQAVQQDVVRLSTHKYANMLVEACFALSNSREHGNLIRDDLHALLDTVLGEAGDRNAPFFRILDDRYGHFVIRRMAENSNHEFRERMRQQYQYAAIHDHGASKSKNATIAQLMAALSRD